MLWVQVADEAAAGLLEVMQAFCKQWDADTWHIAFLGALSYLFELPKTQLAADEDAAAVVCKLHSASLKVDRQQFASLNIVKATNCLSQHCIGSELQLLKSD